MLKHPNLWQKFNVKIGSNEKDIKDAYKKLALKYHPDRNKQSNTTHIFQEITNDRDYLLSNIEIEKTFSEFKDNFYDVSNSSNSHGIMLRYDFNLRDAMEGKSVRQYVEVDINCYYNHCPHKVTCTGCNGTGQQYGNTCMICAGTGKELDNYCKNCNGLHARRDQEYIDFIIPVGAVHGQTINYKSEFSGNRYSIVLNYIKHPTIRRINSKDLEIRTNLKYYDMILGKNMSIDIMGKRYSIHIPPNRTFDLTQRLKLNGMGINGGDMYIAPNIIKHRMNQKEIDLLKEIKKIYE